jgi:hypothetical protein
MNHTDSIFFFVALAFMLTHEMDAIKCREWRIFPLTSRLDDSRGYWVFTAVHVPLYLLLFWALFTPGGLNQALMRGLALFFIVHLGLHLLFLRHPQNEFKSALSWILIAGAALVGALHFVVS